MTDTTHLALPLIAAAQAQKHVTHNEALRALDALVMLSVIDRDLTAPPGSPAEGARYLVKATGTGAFAGKDGKIAHFRDGAWAFHTPRAGWILYVADEAAILIHNGTIWQPYPGAATPLQAVPLFGLATTADATNPISAVLNNALFAARTVANGGDGDLRYKLSKASAADTASLLFQDNFSGRAEIGLTGDDDLHLKVSGDGSTWHEGLVIAASTGRVSFPQGADGIRERLAANRTYYVRSDGSDSNSGLTNSSGGAFLTIQKAVDIIAALDISIYDVTIQLAASTTYTGNVVVNGAWLGSGTVVINGGGSTTIVTSSSGDTIQVLRGGRLKISNFKLQSAGTGLYAKYNSFAEIGAGMTLGACTTFHFAASNSATVSARSNYTITGGATYHCTSGTSSYIEIVAAVTLTGTIAFGSYFSYANRAGLIYLVSTTFDVSGATVTGGRFRAISNGLIDTGGTDPATYLPGSSAGVTATQGQYL